MAIKMKRLPGNLAVGGLLVLFAGATIDDLSGNCERRVSQTIADAGLELQSHWKERAFGPGSVANILLTQQQKDEHYWSFVGFCANVSVEDAADDLPVTTSDISWKLDTTSFEAPTIFMDDPLGSIDITPEDWDAIVAIILEDHEWGTYDMPFGSAFNYDGYVQGNNDGPIEFFELEGRPYQGHNGPFQSLESWPFDGTATDIDLSRIFDSIDWEQAANDFMADNPDLDLYNGGFGYQQGPVYDDLQGLRFDQFEFMPGD